MEQRVRHGAADTFMEKHKEQRYFDPLLREAIMVVARGTLDQAMSFHFAYVVTQLGQGIGMRWKIPLLE